MGEDEKQIPAWIQDHIAKAENLISQASGNYHEYGDSNESINEEPAKSTGEKIQNLNNRIKALKDKMAATKSSEQKNLIQQRLKNALQTLSNYKKQNISKESIVNEACWDGYKQVGMKNKGGRQVPNCVPNESVVKEGREVGSIQKDLGKTVEAIAGELKAYKQHKDTPMAKKHVENLKKLNDVKNKLQIELDNSVTSLYRDAELKAED
jgi:hypothetical protein